MTILYNHKDGKVYSCRFMKTIKHPLRSYEKQKITKTWSIPDELQFKVKMPEGKENKPLNSDDVADTLKRLAKFEQAKWAAVAEFEKEVDALTVGIVHDGNTPLIVYLEYILSEYETDIKNKAVSRKSESHASRFRDTLELIKEYLGTKLKLKEVSAQKFRAMFKELERRNIARPIAIAKADVKDLLLAKKISQVALCTAAGISTATLRRL